MRNILGSPVEGADFFDRPEILLKLNRELDNCGNLLMVAPRRVGKTSLVLRLCEQWRRDSRNAVWMNVEAQTNELAFAERLVDELSAKIESKMLVQIQALFRAARDNIRGVGFHGLELTLGGPSEPEFSTLGKALESVFRKIEQGETPVLLAIDELPEFLLRLQKSENGPTRVTAFLHWLRVLRQTFRRNTRWLFLGSIGLNTFVEQQNLQKLINDLQIFTLDAFSRDEADAFLRQLGDSNNLSLSPSERNEIIAALGWPLAYHLQLVFHELLDSESRSISAAIELLLHSNKSAYFDTWRQRISVQFSDSDARACIAMLDHLCVFPAGRERAQILNQLMTQPAAVVEKVDPQLRRLLKVLQRDGYLLDSEGRYAFRSFLLREYWHRSHVR